MAHRFSYESDLDIRGRLTKQLQLGPNLDVVRLLDILKDLLRISQGQCVESKEITNMVIKLTQIKDFRLKKLVYLYLSFVNDGESDMWLQVMNSISNDLAEPSPLLKKASLLLLTDSQSSSSMLSETRLSLLEKSLKDSNSSVRRCAAAGAMKIFKLTQNNKEKLDMSETLEAVKRIVYTDDDANVIVQCIHCLHLTQKCELENRLLMSLLDRLSAVDTWTKAHIVNLFVQVADRDKMTEDEIFHSLNILDPYLQAKHPLYLSLLCSSAMVYVSGNLSTLAKDVSSRVVDFLLLQLGVIPPEIQPAYFSVLETLSCQCSDKLLPHLKQFTPLFSDPAFVKVLKTRLLRRCCTQETSVYILKIVSSLVVTSLQWELMEEAAQVFFTLHQYLSRECETFLIDMLCHESCMIFEAAVTVLWRLYFSGNIDLKLDESSLCHLVQGYHKLSSFNGKAAYFSLLCLSVTKSKASDIVPMMVSELSNWDGHDSFPYKLLLLRFILVFYFLSPTHFQIILGNFISKALRDMNPMLNRQAAVYCRLLNENSVKLKDLLQTLIQLRSTSDGKDNNSTLVVDGITNVTLLVLKRKRFD